MVIIALGVLACAALATYVKVYRIGLTLHATLAALVPTIGRSLPRIVFLHTAPNIAHLAQFKFLVLMIFVRL